LKERVEIPHGEYVDVSYRMFDLSLGARICMKIAGWLCLPFIYVLLGIVRLSPETGFRTISEMISLMPFAFGVVFRYEFYRRSLRSCGENVIINFGAVFYYPEVTIGNNVCIGMYNTIHHCDFGDNILTAERCSFLGGAYYHDFSSTDIPMVHQGGKMKRILIEDDVWIGANAVVMEDVGSGSVIGAGSVIVNRVERFSIVAGNPAKVVKKRI